MIQLGKEKWIWLQMNILVGPTFSGEHLMIDRLDSSNPPANKEWIKRMIHWIPNYYTRFQQSVKCKVVKGMMSYACNTGVCLL